VRISTSHDFDAPVAAVEAALTDPAFWQQLRLRDVAPPRVVATQPDCVVVDMAWAGRLDGLGRRIVGRDSVTWRQTVRIDRTTHTGTLEISSELRVHATCRAILRFTDVTGGSARTRQTLDGELKVNVPLVGGQAERKLAPGIRQRLDDEAAAVRTWLARGASS
jgi:Protein of unknown function (DUF2505)